MTGEAEGAEGQHGLTEYVTVEQQLADAIRQRDAAIMGLEESIAFLRGVQARGHVDGPQLSVRLKLVEAHLQAAKT